MRAYKRCSLCPHRCLVDRTNGEVGVCGESSEVRIAWSGLHRGEEPPISGAFGSGMIFFSGCPLHCQYCQNYQISGADAIGHVVTIDELATMMTELQAAGAATINLVTGTHFIPSIIGAIEQARSAGLTLPIVWNSSGFERPAALQLLSPYIDLYLMDLKTLSGDVSRRFCATEAYVEAIEPVMRFIADHVRPTFLTDEGALYGTLVRHLVFPGELEASMEVLRYISERLGSHVWLSLMVQFEPPVASERFERINEFDYERLLDALESLGFDEGYAQELGENVSWIPDFRRDNPFPPDFADPLPYFIGLKHSESR